MNPSPGAKGARPWWKSPILPVVLVVAIAGAAAGVVLTRSGHSDAAPLATSHTTPTTRAPAAVADCPLTGAPAPGGKVPNRPALAVKVDNYPAARPQSGIDQADIVFEEPVEGGVTRYVAVFQCQSPSMIGPIRSARYPDVGIIDELSDPIFVHVGGINPIQAMIRQANGDNYDLFYNSAIIQHPSGRVAPYDTYISAADAWRVNSQDKSFPAPLFTYSGTVPAGSTTASVHIPYSGTSNETWTWSAGAGKWMLSYSGVPEVLSDGNAEGVTNVVILHVVTTTGPWLENNVGGYEVEVNPTSGGVAQVLRNGVMIQGRWQRASLESPTQLVSASGAPIALAPGTTWIDMVPDSIPVTSAP